MPSKNSKPKIKRPVRHDGQRLIDANNREICSTTFSNFDRADDQEHLDELVNALNQPTERQK